ncbi:MAG: hypothetical protein KF730_05460 [Sphingomonas sp.]|uniref:DUF6471 domain-containing protein n=1 Tax=Sphingomonas sp. TaxID=28214 RepID=UPI0025E14EFC|nr:DUF6471 domain-containing protein [Sphingomonas sp.]MBX3564009.1 hypothetical protein [Sphingomonas sp.]
MSHIRDGGARRILKAEMARKDLNYDGLVSALGEIGIEETNGSLRNKFSRGSFPADFFLQCLAAMDVKTLHLD